MPFHFQASQDISEFTKFKSVLIIPCRFCPAASFSVSNNEPYIEPFKRLLKTASYENHLKFLKSKLEEKGIKADVFKSKIIHQFVLCMWTSKRRKTLLERAKEYEALIVLGCEAATQTVRDSVQSSSCEVIQGLETKGVMSILPQINLAGKISLELKSLTPLSLQQQ
jgi:hypothetical protein